VLESDESAHLPIKKLSAPVESATRAQTLFQNTIFAVGTSLRFVPESKINTAQGLPQRQWISGLAVATLMGVTRVFEELTTLIGYDRIIVRVR
jgi:hypothetical protein